MEGISPWTPRSVLSILNKYWGRLLAITRTGSSTWLLSGKAGGSKAMDSGLTPSGNKTFKKYGFFAVSYLDNSFSTGLYILGGTRDNGIIEERKASIASCLAFLWSLALSVKPFRWTSLVPKIPEEPVYQVGTFNWKGDMLDLMFWGIAFLLRTFSKRGSEFTLLSQEWCQCEDCPLVVKRKKDRIIAGCYVW